MTRDEAIRQAFLEAQDGEVITIHAADCPARRQSTSAATFEMLTKCGCSLMTLKVGAKS